MFLVFAAYASFGRWSLVVVLAIVPFSLCSSFLVVVEACSLGRGFGCHRGCGSLVFCFYCRYPWRWFCVQWYACYSVGVLLLAPFLCRLFWLVLSSIIFLSLSLFQLSPPSTMPVQYSTRTYSLLPTPSLSLLSYSSASHRSPRRNLNPPTAHIHTHPRHSYT